MPDSEKPYAANLEATLARAREVHRLLLTPAEAHLAATALAAQPPERQWIYLENSRRATRFEVGRALVQQSFACRHEDPVRMVALARLAVRTLLRAEVPPEQTVLLMDARAEAWANLGNAHRLCGARNPARRALAEARACRELGSGDPLLRARLFSLRGSLWMDQGKYRRAERCFTCAIALCQEVKDDHLVGRELAVLGACYSLQGRFEEACGTLTAAMKRIKLRRDGELGILCVTTLIHSHLAAGRPEQAQRILRDWDLVFILGAGEVVIWRLRWLQARVAVQLGQLPRAVRELARVRDAFEGFGLPYDAALAGLDLAAVHSATGQMSMVRHLAEDLLRSLEHDRVAPEARTAFTLWLEAVRAERCSEEDIRRLAGELQRIGSRVRRPRR